MAILLATAQVSALHPDFVALFQAHEYGYTGGGYQDQPFHYRLFVPEQTDQPMPLIVWQHGYGEKGQDNRHHLKWLDQLIFRPPNRERYPFYLLAVQCPDDNPYWTRQERESADMDDMVSVVAAIVERLLSEHPIDRQRVYLSGVSSGGSGSWDLAVRRPEWFAAVAPLASGGGDTGHTEGLRNVPIWAFHSRDDGGTPVEGVRQMVEALRRAGGVAHLTEIDSAAHDCWTAAFAEYHLLDWLLAQRRGEKSTPPGTILLSSRLKDAAAGWTWWQALAQIGIPAAIVIMAWKVLRPRRPSRRPQNSQ